VNVTSRPINPCVLCVWADICYYRCLYIYIVDLFDFELLPDLSSLIGNNHVFIVANKIDLFPSKISRRRIMHWVYDQVQKQGLPQLKPRHIFLLSCKTGEGINLFLNVFGQELHHQNKKVYIIGSANSGKSSFINVLMNTRQQKDGKMVRTPANSKRHGQLTVSALPGTTLGFVRIDVGHKFRFYDTPGVILPGSLTNLLPQDELKVVLPNKKLMARNIRLSNGESLLLGGYVRVDMTSGKPFFITAFVSDRLSLRVVPTAEADSYVKKNIGGLVAPPMSPETLAALGAPAATYIEESGSGWSSAAKDIVVPGLGWISLTGCGPFACRVWAPREVPVYTRGPLLPYEMRRSLWLRDQPRRKKTTEN